MRGQTLGHKEARRLLRRDDLRIVYMLDPWRPVPSELTGSDRDVIAVRIEDFFTEQALAGGFLTLAEFRDESGAVILMVEEDDTGD